MVAAARRKASKAGLEIDFVTGLAQQLPAEDGSYDVVIASLVLHHFPSDRLDIALAEVRRVLRPGGRFTLIEIDPGGEGPAPHGHGGFDLHALLERIRSSGFDQVEAGPVAFRIEAFEPMRYAVFARSG
jgi:SAM-dependent methyltransferase